MKIVRPYRGERYCIEKPFGLSILVLGESTFDCDKNPDGLLVENVSEGIIGHVFKGQRDRTITRAACVFSGELQTLAWRQEFWRTAAFTNFVQHNVGDGPRQRPKNEHWEYAHAAFPETLDVVKPQFVLALGVGMWNSTFHQNERAEQSVAFDGQTRPYCIFENGGVNSFVFGIPHPASWGWTYKKWSPWVKAALDKAKGMTEFGGEAPAS